MKHGTAATKACWLRHSREQARNRRHLPLPEATLLHGLISVATLRAPEAMALTYGPASLSYRGPRARALAFAAGLLGLGLQRTGHVGIYRQKRFETVATRLGANYAIA